MEIERILRRSISVAVWIAALAAQIASEAWSQPAWRPDKAVEVITSSAAGGSNDQVARVMQKILQDEKLLTVPINVINKPGGNQTLAPAYLSQHAADPHYLFLANTNLLANHIAGVTPMNFSDFTPISVLLIEHSVFTVRADSPIKNLRDLFERLKADPASMSIGVVSRGGTNYLTLYLAAKSAGVDPRKLKTVVFKTNAESMTSMVGGHLQMVASSVSSALPQVRAGNARMLAIAAPRRMTGALAEVPTLGEQGVEVSLASWRAIFGSKGMTPTQVAFWEGALARMAATDEWKKQLEGHHWAGHFLRSGDMAKYMEHQYNVNKAVMAELGLAK